MSDKKHNRAAAPPALPHFHCISVNCAYCQEPVLVVEGMHSRLDCNSCGADTTIEEDGTCHYCGEDPIVVHWTGEAPPPAKLDRDAAQAPAPAPEQGQAARDREIVCDPAALLSARLNAAGRILMDHGVSHMGVEEGNAILLDVEGACAAEAPGLSGPTEKHASQNKGPSDKVPADSLRGGDGPPPHHERIGGATDHAVGAGHPARGGQPQDARGDGGADGRSVAACGPDADVGLASAAAPPSAPPAQEQGRDLGDLPTVAQRVCDEIAKLPPMQGWFGPLAYEAARLRARLSALTAPSAPPDGHSGGEVP